MNISSSYNLQIRGGPRATPTERRQWLERFQRSGLTQAAFASGHGLKLSTLRYWLYQATPTPLRQAPGPRLQEIHVASRWPDAPEWEAEIGWPDGCRLRLRAALARELAGALLQGGGPCSR
jgi:hypothetical protein